MIFAEIDWSRLIIILVAQLFLSAIYLVISSRILIRKTNRLTLCLSGFYTTNAIGFLINAVYLSLNVNPIVYVLVFITAFMVLFGYIFIVIFMLNLIKLNIKLKPQLIIILSYAFSLFLALLIPGGITVNESTEWRPIYSWPLLTFVIILFTCFIFIPTVIFSKKTYKTFEDPNLKRKLRYFFIGIFLMLIISFGGLINLTWNNPTFRNLLSFIALLAIPAGFLIYYGIGSKL